MWPKAKNTAADAQNKQTIVFVVSYKGDLGFVNYKANIQMESIVIINVPGCRTRWSWEYTQFLRSKKQIIKASGSRLRLLHSKNQFKWDDMRFNSLNLTK